MTAEYNKDQTQPAGLDTAVIHSLAQMLNQDPVAITTSTRFFEDLSFDSTSVLELLMQLETDLGIEFDVETLEPADFDTVGALIAYVAKQSETVD
jgi:acyl carrier protein